MLVFDRHDNSGKRTRAKTNGKTINGTREKKKKKKKINDCK